jgi:3-dehydroquinate synthetase
VLEFLKHDKKNDGANLRFALPKNVGGYELCFDVTMEIIEEFISK